MSKSIFPVSVEEHKELINTLGKFEYVYLFDSRVRTAITFDTVENLFYVCVCAPSGVWITIDSFSDVDSVIPAFNACATAVYASNYEQFVRDMEYFEKVGKRSKNV